VRQENQRIAPEGMSQGRHTGKSSSRHRLNVERLEMVHEEEEEVAVVIDDKTP
jgi:hypothetical protein